MVFTQNAIISRPKQPRISWATVTATNVGNNVMTAGANGSKVVGLQILNNDTIAHASVIIYINDFNGPLGAFNVPAGAGVNGNTPAVDCFTFNSNTSIPNNLPIDSDGQKYLIIKGGTNIIIDNFGTANSAPGKYLAAIAIYQDF